MALQRKLKQRLNRSLDVPLYLDHHQFDAQKPADRTPEIEKVIANADIIDIPGGTPRPPAKEGEPPVHRTALYKDNWEEYVKPSLKVIAEIVAEAVRENPDKKIPKIVTNTNPLDLVVDSAEKFFKEELLKNGVPVEKIPDINVIGMGGTLDESRARTYLADELNTLLASKGVEHHVDVTKCDARVYGEHGKAMLVSPDELKVEGKTVAEFLKTFGLEAESEKIIANTSERTVKGGTEILADREKTTQIPPAYRNGEIIASLAWGEPHTLTASVVHDLGDGQTASGARVTLSAGGKADLDKEWVDNAKSQPKIMEARAAIRADFAKIEAAEQGQASRNEAKEALKGILFPNESGNARSVAPKIDTKGESVRVQSGNQETLETLATLLSQATQTPREDIKIIPPYGDGPGVLRMPKTPELTALIEELQPKRSMSAASRG